MVVLVGLVAGPGAVGTALGVGARGRGVGDGVLVLVGGREREGRGRGVEGGVGWLWCCHGRSAGRRRRRRARHTTTHFFDCSLFASVWHNPNLMDNDEHPLLVELHSLRESAARCQASPPALTTTDSPIPNHSMRHTQQPSSCTGTPSTRRVCTTTPPPSSKRTPGSHTSSPSSVHTQTCRTARRCRSCPLPSDASPTRSPSQRTHSSSAPRN